MRTLKEYRSGLHHTQTIGSRETGNSLFDYRSGLHHTQTTDKHMTKV